MNHIKKRKMLNSIFISVSVLLIAFFASCDNFSEITYESESQELYTVSGKLLSPAGSYENKNARYAIPDFSSANIVYSVEATNESGTTVKGVFENGTTNFSIKLGLGKWTLKATGTVDGKNAVLEGTKEIELTKENPLVSNVSIELLEVYGDGGTGTVKLNLKVPPIVKLVEANWTLKSSPETAYIAYFNVVSDTVTIDTYNTNGKKDFSAGAYELRLYFWSGSTKENKGTLLYYISSEIVNVFSGMETNTWEGSTEYFSENDGNKTVDITEEKIQNFLHTTFYVGKKDDLQREAKDTNPGTYFYPLLKVSEAVKKIQETEKVHHYDSYSIYVYKSEPNDSPEISENVNITIYGEENSVSSLTMSANGGTLTATNFSVTGNISVTSGNATFSGGSVGGANITGGTLTFNGGTVASAEISGGTATLTNTTISGPINLSNGNLTLPGATVNGDITYTGGKLVLEGSTTVASGKKIILSQNLTISVKNLSEDKVSEIEDSSASKNWGGWTNEATILTSESGNMTDAIISKFILDDSDGVRVLSASGQNAVLGLRTTFYVSENGNDNSDGSTEQNAFATVNKAIEKIQTVENINHNSSYKINVSGSVTGPADFSTLSPNDMPTILLEGKNSATITATNSQVIKMPTLNSGSFQLSLSGLTLSGGNTTQDGSIMSIPQNARVSLSNCTITNNTVGKKGAVYVSDGTLILGGTVNITGNKTSSNPNQAANVYLANGSTITLNATGTPTNPSFDGNSRVGVTTDTKPTSSTSVQITSNTGNGFISSFISDEDYTVVQETLGLYLKLSGGSLDIDKPKNVEFKLSTESVASGNLTITVTATGSNITTWNLKIYFSGVDTKASSSTNTINVPSEWPTGTYQLSVSAKYGTYTYGGTYNFEKK